MDFNECKPATHAYVPAISVVDASDQSSLAPRSEIPTGSDIRKASSDATGLSRFDTTSSTASGNHLPLTHVSTTDSAYSQGTAALRQLDRELEQALQDVEIPDTADASDIYANEKKNPYRNWKCGFGFMGRYDDPDEIPNNKTEFIAAVKAEITTAGFISQGLISYNEAIHSGKYHAFSNEFLEQQTDATHKTVGQLHHIIKHLEDIIKEVEAVRSNSNEVKDDLKQAFAHAQPWIKRIRAILINAHVFYKINYVLGSKIH